MATGYVDGNGVWIHGEDDSYATFSDRLNKGQTSISTALAAVNAGGKKPIAKVRRNAALPLSGNTVVPFDGQVIIWPASWNVAQPSRLVLPLAGYWDVRGTLVGTGMDANLLRGWITLDGVEVIDSHIEVNGTAGKHDGFSRPSTIVAAVGAAQYVELWASTEVSGKSLRAASSSPAGPYITLTATWLGGY